MTTAIFCHLSTAGPHTNLQLSSLSRAWKDWQNLNDQPPASAGAITERCVAIVTNLALSVVQLLGQNVTSDGEHVDEPPRLLERLLDDPNHDKAAVESVRQDADELWTVYNAIHHFGKTPNSTKHEVISGLDLRKTQKLVELTVQIWDLVIQRARRRGADLDEFDSILEVAESFDQWNEC